MKKIIFLLAVLFNVTTAAASDMFPLGEASIVVLEKILGVTGGAVADGIAGKLISLDFSTGYDLANRGNRYSFEVLLGIKEGSTLCYGLCRPENLQTYSYDEFRKTSLYVDLIRDLQSESKVQELFESYKARKPIIDSSTQVVGTLRKIGGFWNRNMGFNNSFTANAKTANTLTKILDAEISYTQSQLSTISKDRTASARVLGVIGVLNSYK